MKYYNETDRSISSGIVVITDNHTGKIVSQFNLSGPLHDAVSAICESLDYYHVTVDGQRVIDSEI